MGFKFVHSVSSVPAENVQQVLGMSPELRRQFRSDESVVEVGILAVKFAAEKDPQLEKMIQLSKSGNEYAKVSVRMIALRAVAKGEHNRDDCRPGLLGSYNRSLASCNTTHLPRACQRGVLAFCNIIYHPQLA